MTKRCNVCNRFVKQDHDEIDCLEYKMDFEFIKRCERVAC